MQLLACIGEQFTEGDEICGVVVNMRAKQDKVCLWTKTASNEAVQVRLTILKSGYLPTFECEVKCRIISLKTSASDVRCCAGVPQVSIGKQFKEFLEVDQTCGFLAHVRAPVGLAFLTCGLHACFRYSDASISIKCFLVCHAERCQAV